jgi:hypothetical protein
MIIAICISVLMVAATVPGVIYLTKLSLSLWSDCMGLRIRIAEQRDRLNAARNPHVPHRR